MRGKSRETIFGCHFVPVCPMLLLAELGRVILGCSHTRRSHPSDLAGVIPGSRSAGPNNSDARPTFGSEGNSYLFLVNLRLSRKRVLF